MVCMSFKLRLVKSISPISDGVSAVNMVGLKTTVGVGETNGSTK